jgi:hypothetical protein
LYDFYLAHNGEVWQNYGEFLVPSSAAELVSKTKQYSQSFLEAHDGFPGADDSPAIDFPDDIGTPTVSVNRDDVYVRFSPEIKLGKVFQGTEYSREFVAEARLTTVFGKMMDRAGFFVLNDDVGQQVKNAIGYETYLPNAGEPDSYLNRFAKGSFSFVSDQTTMGEVEYCDTGGDPGPWEVYEDTHGNTKGQAEDKILSLIDEHLMSYYQQRMDAESDEYTAAFEELVPDAEIFSSCDTETIGSCNCRITEDGLACDREKRMTCEYEHTGIAVLTVRLQEDGFVYGFWDGEKNVLDNIKIVFRAVSGN